MTVASRLSSDAQILLQLLRGKSRRGSHAEALNAFYAPQADRYDAFRARLLHGRQELVNELQIGCEDHVIELGCGTAVILEFLGQCAAFPHRIELVDLCPALLDVARRRARHYPGASVIEADVSSWQSPVAVDCVIVSYALTMIPEWRQVIDSAHAMLKPGGRLGVVDFHLPLSGSRIGNGFWRNWFGHDGVILSQDLLTTLKQRFPEHVSHEAYGAVPYLPMLRAPYFSFIGRRSLEAAPRA